ncbi:MULTISPECIES: hypothetical protein [unclassified Pseudoalteromonas]|uniref:hypothetical protein n=1 Tax=unclassified Pseudoalteromonas TaxID=194690 RepID=UPI001BA7E4A6|nr:MULTISPECIES: hypothetical protein [unclassified Pseudoalteromonas]MCF2826887.1 hypothetical protein [Pseudoalteromonas sp. OF5H-5]MCF2830584.1 hypothetical protein [Pseudoalteromonas sp. DL2-H6]MCF2923984.1 hypothetical protein [Pseudoalteromonas sp. DL2-H1]QUI71288.1 hypothetical protein GSF13_16705 [Pseudoalteromonas sp. M8]
MNDFFVISDWMIRALEVLICLYLLFKFKNRRWSLFFGGKNSLKTIQDHELHSCFLSAFTVMVFHFTSSNLAQHIVTIQGMEKLALRHFFYFSMFSCSMAFAAALFFLHKIRGCSFSPTARNCLYITFLMSTLQMLQFVSHGLLDSNRFTLFYQYGVVVLNVTTLAVVANHPIRHMLRKLNRKEA